MKRDYPEAREQAALIEWWDLQCKAWGIPARMLYASMNGAHRTGAIGIQVGLGMRPGLPDLNLDVARGGYFGLRIEMKAPGKLKMVSAEQAKCHAELRAQGYKVVVCDQWQHAEGEIREYLQMPKTPRFVVGELPLTNRDLQEQDGASSRERLPLKTLSKGG